MAHQFPGERPRGVWSKKEKPIRLMLQKPEPYSQCTREGNTAFPVSGRLRNTKDINSKGDNK